MSLSDGPTPLPIEFPPNVKSVLTRLHAVEFDDSTDAVRALAGEAATLIENMAKKLNLGVISVDLTTNVASRQGVSVTLTPNQASLVYVLAKQFPELVPVVDLAKAVWGARLPRSINTVRVMITDLRLRLIPLSANVQNQNGRGYRLELEPME